jgi:polysaccharide export outer membrane protein
MQGKFDTARLSEIKLADPVIQKGDLLSIIVYSDNPQATAIYNQSLIASGSSSTAGAGGGAGGGDAGTSLGSAVGSPTSSGYLVNADGNIEFQGLGTLRVEGLTRTTLRDTLSIRLKDVLKNAYFNIRFLNYRFTMLGELNKPGVYGIPGEHISILQALGMAGDMTIYGRRENVLVIREVDGKRQYGRLDLTSPEIMGSPYFYLQQNDVVIVEPTKAKAASTDLTVRNVSIAATVVTTLAVILTLLKK